ncbi:hypothetical protein J0S82_001341, partial [Galemys pyrenaicus]
KLVIPLAIYKRIYKKSDVLDIKGDGHCSKRNAPTDTHPTPPPHPPTPLPAVTLATLEESLMLPSTQSHWAREWMLALSTFIINHECQGNFLKRVKENSQLIKESQRGRKVLGFKLVSGQRHLELACGRGPVH